MTVDAIKDAISALPLDQDAWDRQMVEDFSPGGRGMALIEKVKCEIAQGKTTPFEERHASEVRRRSVAGRTTNTSAS